MTRVASHRLIAQMVQALQTVVCEAPERLERSSGLLVRTRKVSGASLVHTLVVAW